MRDGLPIALDNLINELSKLPTIGRRSATRLAFHILRSPAEYSAALASSLSQVHECVHFCKFCGFLADTDTCNVCRDEKRNWSIICVVEDIQDVIATERTAGYNGLYHVLGGHLSPLRGITAEDLNIASLITRIETSQQNTLEPQITEVILATNPTSDGDATAIYLSQLLGEFPDIQVTRPSLEYTDEFTLLKALEGRNRF